MNSVLRDSLIRMLRLDYDCRDRLVKEGRLMDAYDPLMEKIHIENGRQLEKIIEEHGWPSREMVGEDGEEAAWILAQHAISLPRLQRLVLLLMKKNPQPTAVMLRRIAKLEDRICFFEGKKQRYGTNFDWDEKEGMSPTPIADPDDIDTRRAQMGLQPLAKAIAKMRQEAEGAGLKAPKDPQRKKKEFEAWVKRTGWRS